MKLQTLNATMGVLATATLFACSSAPPPPTGSAGKGGGSTAGQTGTQGAAGAGNASGSAGAAGAGNASGSAGSTAGAAGAGNTPGTAGSSTGGTGGASAGTAGAGGTGTAGAGTAGAGGTGPVPCPTGVQGHCNSDTLAAMNAHPGYTLALAEEFDTPIDLDTDPVWTWSDGSPQDGQTRFRASQISFTGGKMIIKAESPCATKTGGANSKCIAGGDTSYAEPNMNQNTGTIGPMGVWSGEFRTKYNNYRYGYYEAKFKAPTANAVALTGGANDNNIAGDYLSTLFVFRSPKWQEWNEIDIELEPNHNHELAGNCVNAMGRTGYPADKASAFDVTMGLPANYVIRDEHTYAFEWTASKVVYYVDGMVSRTFTGDGNVPVIPPKSAKIMMNLWVFDGTAFGDGSSNVFPFQSEYEYFRFYKANTGEATYPCSPTPSCLPASDLDYAQNNPSEMHYGM